MVDIYVYGDIGESFWGDDTSVSASDFSRQLRDADGDDVTIHVNSVGGNVFDANTMSELLSGTMCVTRRTGRHCWLLAVPSGIA
jgi:ATP-dependent protease ClpP protease subunit